MTAPSSLAPMRSRRGTPLLLLATTRGDALKLFCTILKRGSFSMSGSWDSISGVYDGRNKKVA